MSSLDRRSFLKTTAEDSPPSLSLPFIHPGASADSASNRFSRRRARCGRARTSKGSLV